MTMADDISVRRTNPIPEGDARATKPSTDSKSVRVERLNSAFYYAFDCITFGEIVRAGLTVDARGMTEPVAELLKDFVGPLSWAERKRRYSGEILELNSLCRSAVAAIGLANMPNASAHTRALEFAANV